MNKKYLLIWLFFLTILSVRVVSVNGAIIENPIPGIEDIPTLIQAILDGLLYIGGGVFVLIIIISGIKLMSSFGNPEEFKKAKNTIWYACLGLIVFLASKAILDFVKEILNQK